MVSTRHTDHRNYTYTGGNLSIQNALGIASLVSKFFFYSVFPGYPIVAAVGPPTSPDH